MSTTGSQITAKQGLSESEFLNMINAIYHNKILKDSNGSYNEFSTNT